LTRSEELDKNSASISDVLSSFAKDVPADIYILAHTTAPFIKKESIEKGIDSIISGKYDSAFAAQKVQDFMWRNGKPMNYDLTNIPRTQDLDLIYKETCGLYIYTNEVISKMHRRIGEHPYIVEIGEIEGIDIDEAEDFMIADAIFNYFNNTIKVMGEEVEK
jgi:CMP-N-acetylneuraminic acid synthetase